MVGALAPRNVETTGARVSFRPHNILPDFCMLFLKLPVVIYLLALSTYTNELYQLDMQLLLEDFITRNDYRRHTFALSNKSH